MAGGIFGEDHAAEASHGERVPGVVEVDEVNLPGAECLREVDEDRSGVALVFQLGCSVEDLVDVQRITEIDLDALAVLKHLETDSVFSADALVVRIDADVEVIVEQVVVGAVGTP